MGGPLKNGVIYGIKICYFNIIPTLFPFFILSDLWSSVVYFPKKSLIVGCFERLFHINSEGFSVFILGNLCGFPLGAKMASEKYKASLIDKREMESLSVTSSNPSAAFVVSGIGLGLFGSIKIGLILYISVLISAVIVGIIYRPKAFIFKEPRNIVRQKFNLIESVKSAGSSSIVVASYIIFFSSIIGVVKALTQSRLAISLISSFLEVGSACTIIFENGDAIGSLCLPLIAFSLGFSGLSVFMQAFSILPKSVSKRMYLFKKLLQGILSALLTLILLSI